MGVLLAIALIAYVVTKTVSDARIDHTYAKQGLVSPRLEAKYGSGAREKTARYGFADYLGDAWSDHWQRRAAALEADRAAYVANPGERVRLRDRLARAKQVMNAVGRKLVDPVPAKQPADEADVVPAGLVPALAVDTGDVPVDTVRITDGGREQWDGAEWKPAPEDKRYASDGIWALACPKCGEKMRSRDDLGYLLCEHCGIPATDDQPIREAKGSAANPPPRRELHRELNDQAATTKDTTTGGTMTAPTGEAVNYETTIDELEKLAREQRSHLDSCQAAVKSINDAKSSINDMQESYRASAAAASATLEHLAAKNLDGVTLANAGTTADAMPAGAVDVMYDQLEVMEVEATTRLNEAEVALGATEANLAHIRATYSAAHETVAGNLGGNASFLDSGGAVGGGMSTAALADAAQAAKPPAFETVNDRETWWRKQEKIAQEKAGSRPDGGGIVETGDGDINFTGVMGGGGVKVPKVPASGAGGASIQHNGTGGVNVSGSAFGDNATVNNS